MVTFCFVQAFQPLKKSSLLALLCVWSLLAGPTPRERTQHLDLDSSDVSTSDSLWAFKNSLLLCELLFLSFKRGLISQTLQTLNQGSSKTTYYSTEQNPPLNDSEKSNETAKTVYSIHITCFPDSTQSYQICIILLILYATLYALAWRRLGYATPKDSTLA